MIYRWIYNIWRFFLISVSIAAGLILSLLLVVIGVIQLPQSKDYLKTEIENTFNEQFEGTLNISSIDGFLPFQINFRGGQFFAAGDISQPAISFENANVAVNWWDLLQKNLSIESFELHEPAIQISQNDDGLNIAQIFIQRPRDEDRESEDDQAPFYEDVRIFDEIDLFAPRLSIINGSLLTSAGVEIPDELHLPTPLNIQHLNTDLFLEITESQLFADISNFSAVLPDTPYQWVRIEGQFYNNDRFFEVNGLNISTAESNLDLSFEAQPVSIFRQSSTIADQLRDAEYQITVNTSTFSNDFATLFVPQVPDLDEDFSLELQAEGTAEELWIDRFQASFGESAIIATANLNNILSSELSYDAQIENIVLQPDQLQWVSDNYINQFDTQLYQNAIIRGDIYGNMQETTTDFSLETEAGSMMVDLFLNHREDSGYELLAELDSLNISPILKDSVSTSMLNGRIALSGSGFDQNAAFTSSADLSGSVYKDYDFQQIMGEFDYADRQLSYSLRAEDQNGSIEVNGKYNPTVEYPNFTAEGSVQNLNFATYTDYFQDGESDFNATFSANVRGNTLDTVHGRISVEVDESVIGPDTLRAHQLYADLSAPDQQPRVLRFTSSFFDGEIEGTIAPSTIRNLGFYWGNYLQDRIRREVLFDREFTLADFKLTDGEFEYPELDLSLQLSVKDLNLLRHYLPELPEMESRARLTASLNASEENLLMSGTLFEENFQAGDISAQNLNTSVSAEFNHGESIRDFGNLDLQINSGEVNWDEMTFYDSYLNFSMRNDSLQLQQQFVLDDNLEFQSSLTGALSEGMFEVIINNLQIGSPQYNWRSEGESQLIYTDDKKLTFNDVRLTSDEDLLAINGVFSEAFEDSVDFKIDNFDLSRISDLIGGRITFSGILNGEFITRSLTQIPSIQGEINVDEVRVNERLIGDMELISEFNSEEERFDTSVRVSTDPDKYSNYLSQNDNIGQDLRLDGYFRVPNEMTSTDEELYYFDADLREIDLWILTFIVPNIIEEMEGAAQGTGFISGTRSDFDFNSDFSVDEAVGTPFFTNVEYQLEGGVNFNKSDGLTFNEVLLTDHRGGEGTLTGTVDLNDFQPGTFMDLTIDLNNLQFMNNPYDPDIPFYGSLYGTGQAQISGSNTSPFLRTNGTVSLSSDSRISIPLEEETEFEQDRRFIQFVDTFDLSVLAENIRRQAEEDEENGSTPEELTFVELFTMDVQFEADDPINVQLIFDPVTNEILNADGTGQVRILLQDQDVSMFGRFNIQSGDYQFVSGDIFTRRFTLQEGGAISWQGDLVDAGLDVTAVYRARPVISTLLSSNAASFSPESGQRIPIELVLQIGGTITQVENDFFFRVPTGIEGTMDPTLSSQINNLNQNEEEKLIQATSILLSGNFIPSSQAQGLSLGEGFSGTAAVVNPLLSSQVINPLLSNQINSLLRSDITFDIDLNLTAFNEVDLGVALRLFDDRVVLRREGQITGEQSDIGDLGATYRINRTFSLTAFHRQDPTLSYTSNVDTRQTQEMNGVGLEAQVQFNTWQQFKHRITNAFRGIFGLNKRDEESESSDDNDDNSVDGNNE
ncbi:translocation/assembly module TamB domain-containing protein [Rhodohalobacter barkolensis]|uniref:AsmA domain-containing protein n=1 Tax=Rhodohalobacter barkolensis TaxID=2053187 RepID=A0A2N0VM90_9BACT|nr:hypothetical protein [Rhodohalobacter barkolensis]PKD45269.1 hypothetical protein CWD77_07450 [Rhodohalobacter barkolensis]